MKSILLFLFVFISVTLNAQVHYEKQDTVLFKSIINLAKKSNLQQKNLSEITVAVAQMLIGKPYVGATLEILPDERLIVNLRELDCVTFVEASVTLARIIKTGKTSFADYCRELQKIRYRNGVINQYPSRLHYFADWTANNQKKGIIENVTAKIGGIAYDKEINYMTTNVAKYEKLKNNQSFVDSIQSIEKQLNSEKRFYIPKDKIAASAKQIKDGDILSITTNTAGLDASHTGLALWQNGVLHLLHASYTLKKVTITKESLTDYLKANKSQTGIIVLRVIR